jgi:hypothetical protein
MGDVSAFAPERAQSALSKEIEAPPLINRNKENPIY